MSRSTALKRFGVSMEEDLLERFDELCTAKGYTNRSEAIRDMVRDHLIEDEIEEGNVDSVGTLTVVYDHHQRELQEKLTGYQHHHLDAIVSTLHVHLDAHLCLEVIILRGKSKGIKKIAEGLIAAKGVKHGKLVLTTGHH
ncbi:MAG: nickel-responsive transcriptional regulator NikR [Terriglobia bacterium]